MGGGGSKGPDPALTAQLAQSKEALAGAGKAQQAAQENHRQMMTMTSEQHAADVARMEGEAKRRDSEMKAAQDRADKQHQATIQQQQLDAKARREEMEAAYQRERAQAEERSRELAAQRQAQQEETRAMMERMMQQQATNAETVQQLMRDMVAMQTASDPKLMEDLQSKSATIAKLEEEKEMAADPKNHAEVTKQRYIDFCEKLKDLATVPKTSAPSIAIVGRSGTGKSSLINFFAKDEVAEVGNTECTMEIERKFVSDKGVEYYDVPGENDARSYTNLEYVMGICTMHVIIIAYTTRVDSVLNLVRLVKSCGIPFVVVRNKCDEIKVQKVHRDKGMTIDQVREEAFKEEQERLNEQFGPTQLFFCAASPDKDDGGVWAKSLDALKGKIEGALGGIS